VTDPHDPRFNPERFRFTDYRIREEQAEVYRQMFPVGTSRTYVEEILVHHAGAGAFDITGELKKPGYKVIIYNDIRGKAYLKGPPALIFLFGKDGKVVNIETGYINVYPEQISFYDVRKSYD